MSQPSPAPITTPFETPEAVRDRITAHTPKLLFWECLLVALIAAIGVTLFILAVVTIVIGGVALGGGVTASDGFFAYETWSIPAQKFTIFFLAFLSSLMPLCWNIHKPGKLRLIVHSVLWAILFSFTSLFWTMVVFSASGGEFLLRPGELLWIFVLSIRTGLLVFISTFWITIPAAFVAICAIRYGTRVYVVTRDEIASEASGTVSITKMAGTTKG